MLNSARAVLLRNRHQTAQQANMTKTNPPEIPTPERLIELYETKHTNEAGYGGGKLYHKQLGELCASHHIGSVLDWGCGKGGVVNYLNSSGMKAQGYDPAMPEFKNKPKGRFDCVCCFDVAEHWHPDRVDEEIRDVAIHTGQLAVFVVSCRVAVHQLPDGTNCHTIVESGEWWRDRLNRVMELEGLTMEFHSYNPGRKTLYAYFLRH